MNSPQSVRRPLLKLKPSLWDRLDDLATFATDHYSLFTNFNETVLKYIENHPIPEEFTHTQWFWRLFPTITFHVFKAIGITFLAWLIFAIILGLTFGVAFAIVAVLIVAIWAFFHHTVWFFVVLISSIILGSFGLGLWTSFKSISEPKNRT